MNASGIKTVLCPVKFYGLLIGKQAQRNWFHGLKLPQAILCAYFHGIGIN